MRLLTYRGISSGTKEHDHDHQEENENDVKVPVTRRVSSVAIPALHPRAVLDVEPARGLA